MNSNNENTDDIFNVADKDHETIQDIIKIIDQSPVLYKLDTMKEPDTMSMGHSLSQASKLNLDDAEIMSIERLMTNPVNLIKKPELMENQQ
jgi:hypothetical protein